MARGQIVAIYGGSLPDAQRVLLAYVVPDMSLVCCRWTAAADGDAATAVHE